MELGAWGISSHKVKAYYNDGYIVYRKSKYERS